MIGPALVVSGRAVGDECRTEPDPAPTRRVLLRRVRAENLAKVVAQLLGLVVGEPERDLPVADRVGARGSARLADVAVEGCHERAYERDEPAEMLVWSEACRVRRVEAGLVADQAECAFDAAADAALGHDLQNTGVGESGEVAVEGGLRHVGEAPRELAGGEVVPRGLEDDAQSHRVQQHVRLSVATTSVYSSALGHDNFLCMRSIRSRHDVRRDHDRSGDVTLAGTFTTPDGPGPHPTALLLAGSGPLDRDGNARRLPLNLSRDLARMLAEHGWASVRYDKRGVGTSTGQYLPTGFYDELDDAEAVLGWLRGRPDVSTIVPVGHSAGASMAAELAVRHDTVDGAVLLAATAKTGEQTLIWQASQIDPTLPALARGLLRLLRTDVARQQRKALDRITATDADVARIQGAKINARWMREFIAYDPVPALRSIAVPTLAMTGSKDVQVDPDDIATIAASVARQPKRTSLLTSTTSSATSPGRCPTCVGTRSRSSQPIDPASRDGASRLARRALAGLEPSQWRG